MKLFMFKRHYVIVKSMANDKKVNDGFQRTSLMLNGIRDPVIITIDFELTSSFVCLYT